ARQLVAEDRGALEFQRVARSLHLTTERVSRSGIGSLEERTCERKLVIVLRDRASADTGAEALSDLVPDASGRAPQLEELALIGKVDRHVAPAIAKDRKSV